MPGPAGEARRTALQRLKKTRWRDQQLADCHTNCTSAACVLAQGRRVARSAQHGHPCRTSLPKASLCWSIRPNKTPSRHRNPHVPQQCCPPQTSAMFFACSRPATMAAPSATQSCRTSVVPRWQARWARSSGGAAAGAATRSAARRLPLAVVARRGGEHSGFCHRCLRLQPIDYINWKNNKWSGICRSIRRAAWPAQLQRVAAAAGQGVCAARAGPAGGRLVCGAPCGRPRNDGSGLWRCTGFCSR